MLSLKMSSCSICKWWKLSGHIVFTSSIFIWLSYLHADYPRIAVCCHWGSHRGRGSSHGMEAPATVNFILRSLLLGAALIVVRVPLSSPGGGYSSYKPTSQAGLSLCAFFGASSNACLICMLLIGFHTVTTDGHVGRSRHHWDSRLLFLGHGDPL